MRRLLLGAILFSLFVLALSGTASAAPPFAVSETDSYYVFGEIDTTLDDSADSLLLLGSGYAMSKEMTLGVQIGLDENDEDLMGFFLTYTTKPLVLNLDLRWSFPGLTARADALYLLDLLPFRAGLSVGAAIDDSDISSFVEVAASFRLVQGFTLYAAGEYYPDTEENLYQIGVAYGF